jgi:hypothetical protein
MVDDSAKADLVLLIVEWNESHVGSTQCHDKLIVYTGAIDE